MANTIKTTVSLSGVSSVELGLKRIAGAVSAIESGVAKFASVSQALPALFAAITAASGVGALVAMGKAAIDTADGMGKAAQKAGQLVEEFAALAYSANLGEVDQSTLIRISKELSDQMVQQGRSTSGLREEILSLADEMAAIPEGAARVDFAYKRLGKSAAESIPWLSQGRKAIEAEMEEAKEFGQVIGPEFAANADAFNDNLTRMNSLLTGFGLMVADKILPDLVLLTNALLDASKKSGILETAVALVVIEYQNFVKQLALANYLFQSATGFMGEFLGTLYSTGSYLNAYTAGTKAASSATEAFHKRLKEIQDITAKRDDKSKPLAGGAEADEDRIKRLKEELKVERELIDVQIDSFELDIKRAQLSASERGFMTDAELANIRGANELIKKLIQQKMELTSLAEHGGNGVDSFLTQSEANAYRNKDGQQQLGTQAISAASKYSDTNVFDQIGKAADEMEKRFGTLAMSIGRAFTDVIGGSINAISEGIGGLIRGTMTWGQAMQHIGMGIVNSVIDAFSRMVAEWLVTHVLMNGISNLFRVTETAQTAAATSMQVGIHTAGEVSKTGASSAGSLARGVIRVGETIFSVIQTGIAVAAFVAGQIAMTAITIVQSAIRIATVILEFIPYLILAALEAMSAVASIPYVGPILAIAAAAAVIGAGVSIMAGGFKDGGYTGNGPADEVAGPVHRGEYVISAPALNRLGGAPAMDAMVNGGGGPGGGSVNVHAYFDPSAWLNAKLTSGAADDHFVELMGRNMHKFRR